MSACKKCRICEVERPLADFSKDAAKKDGIRSVCKACDSARTIDWQRRNVDRTRQKNANWQKKNPQSTKARSARLYAKNPEKNYAKSRAWIMAHPEVIKARNAARRGTPKGKISDAVRRAVNRKIRAGSKLRSRTFDLLGYSVEHLMNHLEGMFSEGMSWDNYGKGGWEIDHKMPLIVFNYEDPYHIDFKRAWALGNLQPLWIFDNRSKGAKISAPFQPSLQI